MVPSNVDIATVDIIDKARKAEPHGQCTIGVLTKPDMIVEVCGPLSQTNISMLMLSDPGLRFIKQLNIPI